MTDMVEQETLLIVDDTPENIDVLVGELSPDYRTTVALNGPKALSICRGKFPPDLVLLDIMMPGMDGYEVCRQLKADPRTRDIPVIFVTAKAMEEDEALGLELGAVDYITKPINTTITKARVQTHLALRRQQVRIESSLAQLQELETLRDNLMHMIVHDMRSPLGAIMIGLKLLDDLVGEDDACCEPLDLASTSAHKLNSMMTSLLDISRLESGQMPLSRADHDLMELAEQAVKECGPEATKSHVKLTVGGDHVVASVDSELIGRVLTNLINNAIKFSPTDGTIDVRVTRLDQAVRLEVVDQGLGIPHDSLNRVFDKFCQVQMQQKVKTHSSGLGLTFCKLAVEAHDGQIAVESELGHGCKFHFILPANATG